MKIEKKIYIAWQEVQSMDEETKKQLPLTTKMFGKYQYICTSNKGKISLIYIRAEFSRPKIWEIYSLDGNLFSDVERFKTKKEAMVRIKEYLK